MGRRGTVVSSRCSGHRRCGIGFVLPWPSFTTAALNRVECMIGRPADCLTVFMAIIYVGHVGTFQLEERTRAKRRDLVAVRLLQSHPRDAGHILENHFPKSAASRD